MATVTILGAGDMGFGISTPVAANGHDVRLWGPPLDAEIIETLRAGGTHPRMGTTARPGVRLFGPGEGAQGRA